MDFYDEIKSFKKEYKISNEDLGELIGKTGDAFRKALSRKSLSDLEIREIKKMIDFGKNSTSKSFKEIVDQVFNDIKRKDSIAQSIKVDNYMIREPREVFNTKAGSNYEELPNGKYIITVPMIPVRAQATYISEYADADYISELKTISFIVDRVGKGKYQAFEVQNDSMNDGTINSIPDGAIVLGRELGRHHWKNKLHTNGFPYWIIVHKNTILCKEIIEHDVDKGIITCHSLNGSPEFQDFTINLDDCHQLFNIIKKQI